MSEDFKIRSAKGFTLIEMLMTITLMGILSVVSITIVDNNINESRFDSTLNKLNVLRSALIGNPEITKQGNKMSFGYLGDIGSLPSNGQTLQALLVNPGLSDTTIDSTSRLALGWNGPYIKSEDINFDVSSDAWGNPLIYSSTGSSATITSYGADGVAGGTSFNSDLIVNIPSAITTANVHGFISQNYGAINDTAVVKIFYPDGNGLITSSQVSLLASDEGAFSFLNVPFGVRAIIASIPDDVSPTLEIGPIFINVDRNEFVVPFELLNDLDIGVGSSDCHAGRISYKTGTVTIATRNINFNLDILENLTINAIRVSSSVDNRNLTSIRIDAITYTCTAPYQLVPCNAGEGIKATLSPSWAFTTQSNLTATVRLSNTMASATLLAIQFDYNDGECDIMAITDF